MIFRNNNGAIIQGKTSTTIFIARDHHELKLFGFACIPLSVNHLIALLPSDWRFDITASIVGAIHERELSSASLYRVHSSMNMYMSLMNILNNKGPRMEPWGTPLDREIHLLRAFPILTLCLRFDR